MKAKALLPLLPYLVAALLLLLLQHVALPVVRA